MNKLYIPFFLLALLSSTPIFSMDSYTFYKWAEKAITAVEKRIDRLMAENTTNYGKKITFIKTPVLIVEEKQNTTEQQTHEVAKETLQELRKNGMEASDITGCTVLVASQRKKKEIQNILSQKYPSFKPTFATTRKMPIKGIHLALTVSAQKKPKKNKDKWQAKL